MASRLTPWPSANNTLLVHHLDNIAMHHPDTLYAVVPRSSENVEDGFREVTYRHLSNAVNGAAHWIKQNIGTSDHQNFPTLTYFGPNDLRYAILLLGAVKAGYKMLFPSPRYGAEPLATLIGMVDGSAMLLADGQAELADEILVYRKMRVYYFPKAEELLDNTYPNYLYEKEFEEARSEPLLTMHTSGTTGFPKPVTWTHDWADSFGMERCLKPPHGYESMDGHLLGTRVLSFMPPFHASGIFGSIFFSLCCGSVLIYPPSGLPPSAVTVDRILRYIEADTLAMPVPFLEALNAAPELLNAIASRIKHVMYAGGDLPTPIGNTIASHIPLFTACGSTEMGLWPIIGCKNAWQADQWHYMRFHPAMNMKMHQIPGTDDIYEAVLTRNKESLHSDPGTNVYVQPIFKLFPEVEEYRTSDLFTPHHSNPDLWKFYGRADDLQTFSTGEKFHPLAMESIIARHPEVVEVMLVGTGRPQAALLLRMLADGLGNVEKVWPAIEEANRICPTYAVITRRLVLLVSQPFLKTAKGSVQRHATAKLYAQDIDELFASLEERTEG